MAGLLVISGKRILSAALKVGKPVIAFGDHGACYRITSQKGQLIVVAIGIIESADAVCAILKSESAALVIVQSVTSTVSKWEKSV